MLPAAHSFCLFGICILEEGKGLISLQEQPDFSFQGADCPVMTNYGKNVFLHYWFKPASYSGAFDCETYIDGKLAGKQLFSTPAPPYPIGNGFTTLVSILNDLFTSPGTHNVDVFCTYYEGDGGTQTKLTSSGKYSCGEISNWTKNSTNCSIGDWKSGMQCVDNCARAFGDGYSCNANCVCVQSNLTSVSCSSGNWYPGAGVCTDDCSRLNTNQSSWSCNKDCRCTPKITPIEMSALDCSAGIIPNSSQFCYDNCKAALGNDYQCNAARCKCEKNQTDEIVLFPATCLNNGSAGVDFGIYPVPVSADYSCDIMVDGKVEKTVAVNAGQMSIPQVKLQNIAPGRHSYQVKCTDKANPSHVLQTTIGDFACSLNCADTTVSRGLLTPGYACIDNCNATLGANWKCGGNCTCLNLAPVPAIKILSNCTGPTKPYNPGDTVATVSFWLEKVPPSWKKYTCSAYVDGKLFYTMREPAVGSGKSLVEPEFKPLGQHIVNVICVNDEDPTQIARSEINYLMCPTINVSCASGLGNASGQICQDDCSSKLGSGYTCSSQCMCVQRTKPVIDFNITNCSKGDLNTSFASEHYVFSNVPKNWTNPNCCIIVDGQQTSCTTPTFNLFDVYSKYDATSDTYYGCGTHEAYVICYNGTGPWFAPHDEFDTSNKMNFTCTDCCSGSTSNGSLVCQDDCNKTLGANYSCSPTCTCQSNVKNKNCTNWSAWNVSGSQKYEEKLSINFSYIVRVCNATSYKRYCLQDGTNQEFRNETNCSEWINTRLMSFDTLCRYSNITLSCGGICPDGSHCGIKPPPAGWTIGQCDCINDTTNQTNLTIIMSKPNLVPGQAGNIVFTIRNNNVARPAGELTVSVGETTGKFPVKALGAGETATVNAEVTCESARNTQVSASYGEAMATGTIECVTTSMKESSQLPLILTSASLFDEGMLAKIMAVMQK